MRGSPDVGTCITGGNKLEVNVRSGSMGNLFSEMFQCNDILGGTRTFYV